MKAIVEKEIEQLRDELRVHLYNYHVQGEPTIPDQEFDQMFDRLVTLENAASVFIEISLNKPCSCKRTRYLFSTSNLYLPSNDKILFILKILLYL